MNTLARFVERRAFQVKPEHARNLQRGRRDRSEALDHIGPIRDQRRQTTCGPPPAVSLDYPARAGLARIIIQENAATAIDLDIDETGREDRVGRKLRLCSRDGASPKLTLSMRPHEIVTRAGPRIAVPSNSCGAAIVNPVGGGELSMTFIARLPACASLSVGKVLPHEP